MYNFIDVTEQASEVVLPSEALKFNGEYIENLIPGYRTLNVKGREALSPELTTYETGIRDGAKLRSKRYPARIITVKYQLIADSNEAFREAYNRLASILDVEDAEMIFNDEPDKFFKGTPSLIDEVEPGSNAVIGSIEFTCNDPFKYSVIEYEATTDLEESSIMIDYNGTYKAFPTLEADFYSETEVAEDGETAGTLTGAGDCGYVAFFTEDEKIVQLGDPEEVDGTDAYAKSQTLINQIFPSAAAWGTTAKALWEVNNGVVLGYDCFEAGEPGMGAASYETAKSVTKSATILKKASYANSPTINYTVNVVSSQRENDSVHLHITFTASLGSDSSFFGKGYALKGNICVMNRWFSYMIKRTNEYWSGRTGHSVSFGLTLVGLSETASALTGIKFKVERPDKLGTAGILDETACSDIPISQYTSTTPATYFLTAADYGSGTKWHGPSITRKLSADAAGEIGAKDFTFTYKQRTCIGNTSNAQKQRGGFHMNLLTEDGTVVAGIRICKNKSGKTAILFMHVNGKNVHQINTFDVSYNSPYFGAGSNAVQTSTITKSGNKVTFNIGGYKKTFTNSAITDMVVTKVTFLFEQWSTVTPLAYNGLYSAKFVKNNCDTWKDIPNKFSANDVVIADCENGEIYLNGVLAPELGALGNDWEDFVLTPGLNQIGFSYSEWVTTEYAPSIKVRYREVFL